MARCPTEQPYEILLCLGAHTPGAVFREKGRGMAQACVEEALKSGFWRSVDAEGREEYVAPSRIVQAFIRPAECDPSVPRLRDWVRFAGMSADERLRMYAPEVEEPFKADWSGQHDAKFGKSVA